MQRKEHTVRLTPGVGGWWVARLDLGNGGAEGQGRTVAKALAALAQAIHERERI